MRKQEEAEKAEKAEAKHQPFEYGPDVRVDRDKLAVMAAVIAGILAAQTAQTGGAGIQHERGQFGPLTVGRRGGGGMSARGTVGEGNAQVAKRAVALARAILTEVAEAVE
jgi:hypothetical protein